MNVILDFHFLINICNLLPVVELEKSKNEDYET